MIQGIDPITANMRLAQLLGEDDLGVKAAAPSAGIGQGVGAAAKTAFSGNPFEDMLAKAIESLEGVSKSEFQANQLIDRYIKGEADLQEVMVAQSKASLMAQLAVTTVNSAVNTFKEITQIQI
ncbi:MAG: flagellar hook-basal body complex protein FliE [Candidatus Margulisiibacteriota bacterium]